MRVYRASYRRPNGKKGVLSRWYIECRFRGRAWRIPGLSDFHATKALGRKVQRLIDLREVGEKPTGELAHFLAGLPARLSKRLASIGIIDQGLGLSATTPLPVLLDAWEQSLRDGGCTLRHTAQRGNQARRALEGTTTWVVVNETATVANLAKLRAGGRGLAASNAHLAAARQFCRWAVAHGLPGPDPLAGLRPMNARVDRRVERRALTAAELRALIASAERGPPVLGMPGPTRALLYRLAAETGLRANELRSLTAGSFEGLDGLRPTVRLQAGSSKRRREDVLPLRAETARAIAGHLEAMSRGVRNQATIFRLSSRAAAMLRVDMASAGIEEEDASGRRVDFHALRVTFVTNLARANVPMRLAQTLARHSTPVLTYNVYSQFGDDEQRAALDNLPDLGKHGAGLGASESP